MPAGRFPHRVLPAGEALDAIEGFLSRGPRHWFIDVESPTRLLLSGAVEVVVSIQTPYQHLDILRAEGYGLCLVLDGRMQLAESDEFIYHELLIHPACVLHGAPRRALVIGGGDGCAARELIRYPCLERVVVVDIDQEILSSFRDRFCSLNRGALRDPRVQLVCADAWAFLQEDTRPYDLIISDLTEPYDAQARQGSLSSHLYSSRFYSLIADRLAPGGIFVCQTGGVLFQPHHDRFHLEILAGLQGHFPNIRTCYEYIPSFAELWGVTLSSRRDLQIAPEQVDDRLAKAQISGLRYYDGMSHQRAFTAPRELRLHGSCLPGI